MLDPRRDPGESASAFRRRLARAREFNVAQRAAVSSGNPAPVVAHPFPGAATERPSHLVVGQDSEGERVRLMVEKQNSRAPEIPSVPLNPDRYIGPTYSSKDSPQHRDSIWCAPGCAFAGYVGPSPIL